MKRRNVERPPFPQLSRSFPPASTVLPPEIESSASRLQADSNRFPGIGARRRQCSPGPSPERKPVIAVRIQQCSYRLSLITYDLTTDGAYVIRFGQFQEG